MIGVLVPARNEVDRIGACLASITVACRHPELAGETVCVVVATDHCIDGTATIVRSAGAHVVEVPAPGGVGTARAAAADFAIAAGARWLASTDADSLVPEDWLAVQLRGRSDLFCGLVGVGNWQDYGQAVASSFLALHLPAFGHPHVHGANLGISTYAYLQSGGFSSALTGEDHQLVQRCQALGLNILRSPQARVTTSARREGRAPAGFAAYLRDLESATPCGSDLDGMITPH